MGSAAVGRRDVTEMRILFCDDELPMLRVIQVTLEPRGHTVEVAENARDAADLFDSSIAGGQEYDLIVTDQEMPGSSGFYLCGYVRASGYKGRLAVFTAFSPETANLADVQAEYWPKPQAVGELVARVEG